MEKRKKPFSIRLIYWMTQIIFGLFVFIAVGSIALNIAIGGAKSSQHTRGEAIDIDDTFGHMSNKDMFAFIKDELDFDQLIWEFGDDENPAWVHVSYASPKNNRRRILKAERKNGKTTYNVMNV